MPNLQGIVAICEVEAGVDVGGVEDEGVKDGAEGLSACVDVVEGGGIEGVGAADVTPLAAPSAGKMRRY